MITPIYKGTGYIWPQMEMAIKNVLNFNRMINKIENSGNSNHQIEKTAKQDEGEYKEQNVNRDEEKLELEYIWVNDFVDNKDEDFESFEIARKTFEKDLNSLNIKVRFIQNSENLGIQGARVAGLECASGEFIHFLDQDDKITDDCIVKIYKFIQGNPDNQVYVANGIRRNVDEIGELDNSAQQQVGDSLLYEKSSALKLINRYRTYLYGTDMIFSPGQCYVRKDAIPAEWKDYQVKSNGCDDFFLWLLMFKNGCSFAGSMEITYIHGEHERNISSSKENMDASFYEMLEIMGDIDVFKKHEIKILRERMQLRRSLQENPNGISKALKGIKKPFIMFETILYKMAGFH